MAGLTVTGPLERLARERTALVAWLAARFRGRLSHEDCEDVVAEALPRLAEDPHLPADPAARGRVRAAGAVARRARRAPPSPRPRPASAARRCRSSWWTSSPRLEPRSTRARRTRGARAPAGRRRADARAAVADARRPVLRLKFLDDAEPDEIAEELGVTPQPVPAAPDRREPARARRARGRALGPVCPQVRRLIAERAGRAARPRRGGPPRRPPRGVRALPCVLAAGARRARAAAAAGRRDARAAERAGRPICWVAAARA